jgi:hypothetical protein
MKYPGTEKLREADKNELQNLSEYSMLQKWWYYEM